MLAGVEGTTTRTLVPASCSLTGQEEHPACPCPNSPDQGSRLEFCDMVRTTGLVYCPASAVVMKPRAA